MGEGNLWLFWNVGYVNNGLKLIIGYTIKMLKIVAVVSQINIWVINIRNVSQSMYTKHSYNEVYAPRQDNNSIFENI